MKLYFIALIAPPDVREEIKDFKEEVKKKYGAKHALKIPAHITLQPPFKLKEEEEEKLMTSLTDVADQQHAIEVKLSDFGSFPPRVIYVNVEDHEPIVRLHECLHEVMQDFLEEKKDKKNEGRIHPHVTVASRDLNKKDFKKVWPEFRDRAYKSSFTAKSLFLLKHNGKQWELYKEFPFRE